MHIIQNNENLRGYVHSSEVMYKKHLEIKVIWEYQRNRFFHQKILETFKFSAKDVESNFPIMAIVVRRDATS